MFLSLSVVVFEYHLLNVVIISVFSCVRLPFAHMCVHLTVFGCFRVHLLNCVYISVVRRVHVNSAVVL